MKLPSFHYSEFLEVKRGSEHLPPHLGVFPSFRLIFYIFAHGPEPTLMELNILWWQTCQPFWKGFPSWSWPAADLIFPFLSSDPFILPAQKILFLTDSIEHFLYLLSSGLRCTRSLSRIPRTTRLPCRLPQLLLIFSHPLLKLPYLLAFSFLHLPLPHGEDHVPK